MPERASSRLARALARLDETEPLVHAYVEVDRARAAAAARAVDSGDVTGPLAGWPFGVKEVFSVAGLSAAGGSPAFAAHVAASDASVVARLRAAGAVLVGTHVSHELTCGLDEPPTRNPWALTSYPGGSSAGGGVSVAVGSAQFALGTDAAGSVRIPAAMCGVVGLKPTAGLVSTHGIVRHATAPSIDNVGILARSVSEVAAVLAVITGPDAADAATLWGAGAALHASSGHSPAGGLEGRRLGVLGDATRAELDARTPPERAVWEAFEAVCAVLASLGAELVPVEIPALHRAPDAIFTLFSTELAAAHRQVLEGRAADYHPGVLEMLLGALATSQSQVAEAVGFRGALSDEVLAAFAAARLDALVMPTTPRVAMPLESFDPASELGTLIPYTCPFNLTGQPAVSVPCGFTASGLPIGLQLVGLPFQDVALLEVAAAYEQATTWHTRLPKVF
ncbi:MAG: amidase [bacterium]|nr:amidase [bacterium]MDE0667806.1 amidase [bacterium]